MTPQNLADVSESFAIVSSLGIPRSTLWGILPDKMLLGSCERRLLLLFFLHLSQFAKLQWQQVYNPNFQKLWHVHTKIWISTCLKNMVAWSPFDLFFLTLGRKHATDWSKHQTKTKCMISWKSKPPENDWSGIFVLLSTVYFTLCWLIGSTMLMCFKYPNSPRTGTQETQMNYIACWFYYSCHGVSWAEPGNCIIDKAQCIEFDF